MGRSTILFSALVLCFVLSQYSAAQEAQASQQPSITFRRNSELVLVPVIVTDSKGEHVTDLSINDFTVLENSKQHVVKHFDRIHGFLMPVKPIEETGVYTNATDPGALPPAITILLLDSVNTSALDQQSAIEAIVKMLQSPFPGPVAIWQFAPEGIRVLQDFTTNQKELIATAEKLKGARSAQDLLNTTVVAGHRPYNFLAIDRDYSGTINTYGDVDAEERFNRLALDDADRKTLETMRRIAKALRQVEGRKSLFLATGGLSSAIEDQIGDELAAANVSVYPIEVTPTKGPRDSPVYFNNRVRYRKNEANGLRMLADQTGGVYCAKASDAPQCVSKALADASDYYMLAFSIDSEHLAPGPHPIEVRVDRPGLYVRARRAYLVEHGSSQERPRQAVAAAIDSPLQYTNLPFWIRWIGKKDVDGKPNLSFRYFVPRGVLRSDGTNTPDLDLSFAAAAFQSDGKLVGTFSKDFTGKLSPETANTLADKGFFFDGEIQVQPSATEMRFVMRDNLTGRLGSISVPIAR